MYITVILAVTALTDGDDRKPHPVWVYVCMYVQYNIADAVDVRFQVNLRLRK